MTLAIQNLAQVLPPAPARSFDDAKTSLHQDAQQLVDSQMFTEWDHVVWAVDPVHNPQYLDCSQVFARSCSKAGTAGRVYSDLVRFYRAACLAQFGTPLRPGDIRPLPAGPLPALPGFSSKQKIAAVLANPDKLAMPRDLFNAEPIYEIPELHRRERLEAFFLAGGKMKPHLLPSDKFWGFVARHYADHGYFKAPLWKQVESARWGKLQITKAAIKPKADGTTGWVLPLFAERTPET